MTAQQRDEQGLTARERQFVKEYLVDNNAAAAYIRAGYASKSPNSSKVNACRLLQKPTVAAALEAARTKLADSTERNAAWVLERLGTIVDRCMTEEFNPAGANKALELIGKHFGMFVNKHEVAGADGGPLVVQVMKFADDPPAE